MNKIFFVGLILLSSIAFGQSKRTFVVSDSLVADRWVSLSDNWRYHKGDNPAWAKPEFDDSKWDKLNYNNLNMPDGKNAIAERGEIAWFRFRIMADSSITDAIVLNVDQLGASQIYLDGKLLHQLGRVSANPDSVVFMNSSKALLQLPLKKGKEQVLAIRYVNAQYKFPFYANTNGYIDIRISSLTNSNSHDIVKNDRIAWRSKFYDNFLISLGISIIIFIIFSSFFLFFPNEKINGYFALSALFTVFSVSVVLVANTTTADIFWYSFIYAIFFFISMGLVFYCIYLILEHKIDWIFRFLLLIAFLGIGLFFFYNSDAISSLVVLLFFIGTIRISLKSWCKNRTGALIFITSSSIGLIFWMLLRSFQFLHITIDFQQFIPIYFMLQPVTLAIYLGYNFGKKSQDLRLNLKRVQKLSKDKEQILSKQNETLEQQVKERTASLNESLANLKSTQSQLIQSEKMASLGELTAGIAHEIQNPLNFVNNFSEVNKELLLEMKDEIDKGNINEVKSIADNLISNQEKINHHGKRADSIVKGMLQHSQINKGQKEPTDINALCDEYLKLSYHGLRAKDKNFNANFKTDFDENIGKINIVPQDIGRVLLNLYNNAFYACAERSRGTVNERLRQAQPGNHYEPKVTVNTKKEESRISISVSDNGNGISQNIIDKIFQPFFTTKPTGQGTSLGLSLSYDIVKAHGGEIKVETREGEGTTFTVQLPVF